MAEHLVRVGRLKELQKQRSWSDAELARQCRRTPQQVRSWWANERMIGEKLARSLEAELKLPRYWLDERSGAPPLPHGTMEGAPLWGAGAAAPQGVTTTARSLPVLRWDQLPTMLASDNAVLRDRAPHLDSFAVASPNAKFLQMQDDSMAPAFMPGDHLLFDPIEAPRAGDTVLVALSSGEHFIRLFQPKTAYVWDAIALNKHYQPLSSQDDQARVVAVMVEHRRYRARP
jgi:SOS-response transcriptional repressor LexA